MSAPGTAISAGLRPYLIPTLGFAAMAGGIQDLGRGVGATLVYARASYPVPVTFLLILGLAISIMGVGSIAIGYRAVRHPTVVPIRMLSIMITFLTWQIVISLVMLVLRPPISLRGPVTNATRWFAFLALMALVGACFLFRALRRWLQEHRRSLRAIR